MDIQQKIKDLPDKEKIIFLIGEVYNLEKDLEIANKKIAQTKQKEKERKNLFKQTNEKSINYYYQQKHLIKDKIFHLSENQTRYKEKLKEINSNDIGGQQRKINILKALNKIKNEISHLEEELKKVQSQISRTIIF